MYEWLVPAFGAAPVVATAAERQRVIDQNDKATLLYKAAYAAWEAKQKAFAQASIAYSQRLASDEANYQAAMGRYNQALATARLAAAGAAQAYASAEANYGVQKRARDALIAQNQQNSARILGGTPAPPGFAAAGYCVTQAARDGWAWACAPVRGFGAAGSECVWQNLPVCNLPPAPVPPRPPAAFVVPPPPKKAAPPPVPVNPGPAPTPPVLREVPVVVAPPPKKAPLPPLPPVTTTRPEPPPPRPTDRIPVPPALPPPPELPVPAPQQNLAVWGVLALVVVAGAGGAYWYTHRKKAA